MVGGSTLAAVGPAPVAEVWRTLADWLAAPTPARTLFALLLAGHLLGDFVFQSRALVEAKRSSLRALLHHAGLVTLAHLALVLPFLTLADQAAALLAVAALGVTHLFVDRWKMRVEARDAARGVGPRFRWWVADQLLHLASVVGAWRLLLSLSAAGAPATLDSAGRPLGGAPLFAVPSEWLEPLWGLAVAVGVFAFNVHGAGALVAATLDACERRDRPRSALDGGGGRDWTLARESKAKKGAVIGILERALLVVLVWLGAYGAIGFVLAAKSVARFKDLDDRDFSEGYLVGTLTSTSIALVSGLVLVALVGG